MSINNAIIASLFAFSLIVTACGGGGEENVSKPKTYDFEKADSLDMTYLRELGTIRVSIEETGKLNTAMMEAGFSYNSGALNSASRASSYSGQKGQALALGAFGADLNYCASFNQANDVRSYMDAVLKLSDGLGIRAAFDEEIMTQIAEADSTTDRSLLLTKAYLNAEDQLYSDDRAKLATYMVVGGWIEGMWIAAESMKGKEGEYKIWKGIFSHAFTYNNVMEMLKVFAEKDAEAKSIMDEMEKVRKPVEKTIKTKGESMPAGVIDDLHGAIGGLRKAVIG